jgi:outer membrane protein assembly factor BamB
VKHALIATAAALILAVPAFSAGDAPDSDWNQWRGPKRDGLSPDTGLLKAWPAGGPPLAWKATGVGGGFSSVSVLGGRVLTMGDVGDACNLIALNAADGKIAWQTRVGASGGHKDYPGPRATPASDGELVFALGQDGDLVCAELATGKEKWRKNLAKDFGGKMMSGWRWSESPLLDGDLVLCTPGGSKGTVVALKKSSGDTAWQSSELTDAAAYASLVPVEIGGTRQYLVLTAASVAGIGAADGKVLWRAERSGKTAVIPTPVYKDGLVCVSSSYGVGCNAFRITLAEGKFKAEEAYSGKDMMNHHGGLILVGDHLYEMDDKGGLKCFEYKTGKLVWSEKSVGKGSIAYADGHLICRNERGNGTITLVEATPEGYREQGKFDQPERSKALSWPHPVIIGGKLYIRDQDNLFCYDVKAK